MTPSLYSAPLACKDVRLGARATQALGMTPPAAVAAHLMVCPACRLQRVTYSGLDAHAALPSPALRERIRRAVRERFSTRI